MPRLLGVAARAIMLSGALAVAPIINAGVAPALKTATAGSQFSTTISGAPAGSTITATSSDGQYFAVTGNTITGTFALAGSPVLTLSVTPAGGGAATTYPTMMNVASPNFPWNTPIIFIGDSITDGVYSQAGYPTRTLAKLGGGRYLMPPLGNRGSGGQSTADSLRDFPTISALLGTSPTGVAVVLLGGNPDANITTNLRAHYDLIKAAGWNVIAVTMWNGGIATSFNPWINQQTDVTVLHADQFINVGTSSGANDTNYNDVHLNDQGADKFSTNLAALLNNWSAVPTRDVYADDGTFTNLLPDFGGALTGAFTGTGVSGSLPAGWTGSKYQGDATVTVSVVMDGGYPAIDIVSTGGSSQTGVVIKPSTQPSFSLDDEPDFWIEWEVLSGSEMQFQAEGNNAQNKNYGSTLGGANHGNNFVLTNTYLPYRSDVRTSKAAFNFEIVHVFTGGVPGHIRMRRPRMTKRIVPNFAPRGCFEGSSSNRPYISGTTKVGQTLTCVTVAGGGNTALIKWYGQPAALNPPTFQWYYGDGTAIPGATSSTYIIQAADIGKTIYCTFVYSNSVGSTPYTIAPTAAITAAAPAAPTMTLTAGTGQVSIAWTDNANNGAAITSHKLYRGTVSGSRTLVATISAGSPYTDSGLTSGTTYYYSLSAVNSVGEGSQCAEQSVAAG